MAYIATGQLPPAERVRSLVAEAHRRFGSNIEGTISQVYPALAEVPGDLFGICVAGTSGSLYTAGDAEHEFTIMSVSKPFVFALACEALGPEPVRQRIGVNPTGLPFDSLSAVERAPDGRTNPMVNAGAIAATSLAPGATAEDRWRFLHDGLSGFAGRPLSIDTEVYASASESNHRNQSIGRLLQSYGRI